MVQLSSYPTLDSAAPTPPSVELLVDGEDPGTVGSLRVGSPNTLQVCLEVSTAYYGYETYIEDGLICLKHKVRNMEKKKQKLENYKKRMSRGEVLNKDQLAAVEKYEELLHNLSFARELRKTLDCLTNNLLSAQENAVKQEQMARMERERRRLTLVLQVQHLLTSLQQEHIQRDLLSGHNQAPHVPATKLHSLNQLATQLGVKRDNRLSLKEQMEQAAVVYLDLLEGKDKPVAGSSFRLLKEELTRLLDYKYFSSPPSTPDTPEMLWSPTTQSSITSKPIEVSEEEDFQAMEDGEPPDSWETEFSDGLPSQQLLVHKPYRGAPAFIPKVVPVKKKAADCKKRKERKSKVDQNAKFAGMDLPLEVLSSPCTFPKDPAMRKRHLEDLMTMIHGSFSFIQESLLDGETFPTRGDPRVKRESSKSPSSLVQPVIRGLVDVLPKPMHSTPLPTRLLMHKASLSNGDEVGGTCDLDISPKDLPYEPRRLSERKTFPSPTVYRRESTFSPLENKSTPWMPVTALKQESSCNAVESCSFTPPQGQTFLTPPTRRTLTAAQFQSIHSVCKMNSSSPQKLISKTDSQLLTDLGHNTVGTQTPPEFSPPEYELQSGGSLIPQTFRDFGPLLSPSREAGCQHSYRPEGRHVSRAWTDSYQVSSPDREGTFAVVDSGLGDSMSASTEEVPLSPHHQHTGLVPMCLYSLSQPLRVAFTASRTANFVPGNLDQPIVFDQLYSNLGGMYDTHIGRFTCPVNGTYVFIFHILKLAINMPLYINLMHNEEVIVSAYANDGAPDHETASNHAILPLFQGDQVWLRLHRGAIYGSTWKYSTFSGFLLYQD